LLPVQLFIILLGFLGLAPNWDLLRLKDDYPRLAMNIFGIITKNTNTALRNATNMIAELEK